MIMYRTVFFFFFRDIDVIGVYLQVTLTLKNFTFFSCCMGDNLVL